MKSLTYTLICFFCVHVSTNASLGERSFHNGEYENARDLYLEEIKKDNFNVESLFMLGNTYFRLEDYPKARLFYFRALTLAPRDPDIIYNYNLTQKKLILKSNSLSVKLSLNQGEIVIGTLFFSIALFGLIFSQKFIGLNRKIYNFSSVISLLALAVFLIFANYPGNVRGNRVGVVTADASNVYSGVDSKSVALYKIPKGTLVDVKKDINEYLLIRFNVSEQGWIKKDLVFF